MCGHAPLVHQAVVSIMFIIALTATLLAFVQNTVMFRLGMKELAIFAFPLSFVGIFLAQLVLIWAGYFCVRRFLRHRRALVPAGWTMVVLGAAEPMLPASYFTTLVQHAKRTHVLEQIEQADSSIEALASDQGRLRICWHVEQIDGDPCLLLSWIEERTVGVAVKRDRRGYGRELIERALPYSLNAETRYELDDAGLRCTIALPLAREGPKERGA